MFSYGWIGQSYMRFYTRFPQEFLKKSFQLLRKSLLIGFAVFLVFQFFFTGNYWWEILLACPVFFLFGYYNFFLLACQAQQKAIIVAISELTRTAIGLSVPLFSQYFFPIQFSFEILITGISLSFIIPLLIFSTKIKIHGSNQSNNINSVQQQDLIKQMLNYGIPVAFFLSFSLALTVNDRFVIAWLIDRDTAGRYASVYDLLNRGVTVICSPIVLTFYPHIAKLYNDGNKSGAYRSIKQSLLIEAIIFISGFLLLILSGVWAMNTIFKREIQNEELMMMVMIYTGVFLWQFAIMLHKPLEMLQQTKLMAIGVFIAFILNLLANTLLLHYNKSLLIPAATTIGSSLFYILFVLKFTKRNAFQN